MNAIEKLKLSTELRGLRLGMVDLKGVAKLDSAKRVRAIRVALGGGSAGASIDNGAAANDAMVAAFKVRITTENPREGQQVPAEWFVFNAPRPLLGTKTFNGDFLAGRFYAAVDPENEFAKSNIEENRELDARLVKVVFKQTIINMYLGTLPDVMRPRIMDRLKDDTLDEMYALVNWTKINDLPYAEFKALKAKAEANDFVGEILSRQGGSSEQAPVAKAVEVGDYVKVTFTQDVGVNKAGQVFEGEVSAKNKVAFVSGDLYRYDIKLDRPNTRQGFVTMQVSTDTANFEIVDKPQAADGRGAVDHMNRVNPVRVELERLGWSRAGRGAEAVKTFGDNTAVAYPDINLETFYPEWRKDDKDGELIVIDDETRLPEQIAAEIDSWFMRKFAVTSNPLYQSVIDGAPITTDLIKQLIEEGKKDPSNAQLKQAVQIIVDKVKVAQ